VTKANRRTKTTSAVASVSCAYLIVAASTYSRLLVAR